MSKKIVGGIKDENGIFISIKAPPQTTQHSTEEVMKASDINLDELLEKHLLVLYRETKCLLMESSTGKLTKDSSQCMRDNIKLLMELKKKEKEILDNLSEDELASLSKE